MILTNNYNIKLWNCLFSFFNLYNHLVFFISNEKVIQSQNLLFQDKQFVFGVKPIIHDFQFCLISVNQNQLKFYQKSQTTYQLQEIIILIHFGNQVLNNGFVFCCNIILPLTMGNLQQKMTEVKPIDELAKQLKHIQQTRPDSQIEITDKLTFLLSDLNIERISQCQHKSSRSLDWSNYIFVCIQGLPAIENQFKVLDLPGTSIYYASLNFSPQSQKLSSQQRQKLIYETTFQKDAERLHKILNSIQKNKKIIFVYHSAGNFILSMYFYYYGQDLFPRIRGMIDLAGAPLRYYISARTLVPVILNTDFSQIAQNADNIHKIFTKTLAKTGFNVGFKSKYQTISFLYYIKSPDYGEIFQATWNHPKVLKLFIHGRNDTLFESSLLNQKVIYYTYRRELEQEYTQKLKQKYKEIYHPRNLPQNIQQRFILAIPKGQHSVHSQERNWGLIRDAVHQYLAVVHEL